MAKLILASASPRRRELLGRLGVAFEVRESGLDEAALRHLRPRPQAAAAARGKAEAVAAGEPGAWVLGSDTVVAIDGQALGQPADIERARAMLARLSGRQHSVITACWLIAPAVAAAAAAPPSAAARGSVSISQVRFRALAPTDIDAYLATDEWRDKAGAYAIQGGAGAFAEVVRGDTDTVIGLPLLAVRRLLREMGFADARV